MDDKTIRLYERLVSEVARSKATASGLIEVVCVACPSDPSLHGVVWYLDPSDGALHMHPEGRCQCDSGFAQVSPTLWRNRWGVVVEVRKPAQRGQPKANPKASPKTSVEFLQACIDVQVERGKEYDQPGGKRSMGRCVQAFNAITGKDLTEAEGWLLLQILKDVRQWQNPGRYHEDSALDGVSYSSLKAEALATGADENA